jgi:hypothetical protein
MFLILAVIPRLSSSLGTYSIGREGDGLQKGAQQPLPTEPLSFPAATATVTPSSSPPPDPLYFPYTIAATVFKENVSWLYDNFHGADIVLLTRENTSNPYNTPNVAFEAFPFVRFITMRYDDFPDHPVFFIHGPQHSWHVVGEGKTSPGDLAPIIRAANKSLPYLSINFQQWYDVSAVTYPSEYGNALYVWDKTGLLALLGPIPKHLVTSCCAQFMVSREAVHRLPKEVWVRIDAWLTAANFGPINDKEAAVALEHMWFYLFMGLGKSTDPDWSIEYEPTDLCEVLDCTIYKGPRTVRVPNPRVGAPPPVEGRRLMWAEQDFRGAEGGWGVGASNISTPFTLM